MKAVVNCCRADGRSCWRLLAGKLKSWSSLESSQQIADIFSLVVRWCSHKTIDSMSECRRKQYICRHWQTVKITKTWAPGSCGFQDFLQSIFWHLQIFFPNSWCQKQSNITITFYVFKILKILKSCLFSPSPGQDLCTVITISSYEKAFTRVTKAAIFSQNGPETLTATPSAFQEKYMEKHCIVFQSPELSRILEKLLLNMM